MVAIDLAVSKETDTFHPHKQARLYGITTALSQYPEGNLPLTHLCTGWGGTRGVLETCVASGSPDPMVSETQSLPSRVVMAEFPSWLSG